MLSYLKSIFDSNARELRRIQHIVDEINALEKSVRVLKDSDFQRETQRLKEKIKGRVSVLDKYLPLAYALVREAARRVLGERHYDVQLIAAVALHEGKIAEQKTGEGKTLSATAPLYLNALTEKGVHLVTVNDYLARRDAGWMGMVFDFLGLSTSAIISEQSFIFDKSFTDKKSSDWRTEHLRPISRKEAYRADITYGINSEFGFDYLRDNMVYSLSEQVRRGFNYAIIDGVDSVLIDEARTPHIISAPYDQDTSRYYKYAQIVQRLMSETDYVIDEKMRTVNLTERGIEKIEKLLGTRNIYETDYDSLFHIEAALKARTLFTKDRDYIVRNNEVVIVDEFTGRLLEGRRFSEGIHQAIEAKEGVPIKKESKTLATVSLQNYFRMYDKLAGMTGTAATESEEFYKIYKLEVVVVPTNKPIRRRDHPDFIYKTERGKFTALTEAIYNEHKKGRPVLVGTTNIEKNETLSSFLKKKRIPHEVLNAKNHEREAHIIANAGKRGAVTIATNMAGRGVDIILGGTPPNKYEHNSTSGKYIQQRKIWKKDHDEVVKLGGLYVIGTERHESRRIDNQLRGRAGRQGDPGETRFFISLEDDMLRVFGGEQIQKMMTFFKFPENQPIEHSLVSKSIEQAQVKVEGFHFDSRKHLLEFDDVLNKQREFVYARRRQMINKTEKSPYKLREVIVNMFKKIIDEHRAGIAVDKQRGVENLISMIGQIFAIDKRTQESLKNQNFESIALDLISNINNIISEKEKAFGKEVFYQGVKVLYLSTIDYYFTQHLTAIENLREGINLRGYAQLDPLVEYKKEAYSLFQNMMRSVHDDFIKRVMHLQVQPAIQRPNKEIFQSAESIDVQNDLTHQTGGTKDKSSALNPPKHKRKQSSKKGIGRNDPCWCGSGKKWKKCHWPDKETTT